MLRTALLIGLGGFVGANLRYWLGGWIAQKIGVLFPIETMLINLSGSFLLGLFMTLALHFPWSPEWRQLIAIGFIGSFTTYSTYEQKQDRNFYSSRSCLQSSNGAALLLRSTVLANFRNGSAHGSRSPK